MLGGGGNSLDFEMPGGVEGLDDDGSRGGHVIAEILAADLGVQDGLIGLRQKNG